MANQGPQKFRRNPSPSCLRPLKATQSFGLKASPSASPTPQWTTDPHRKTRRSPDHRASPDRHSPCSPGFKDKCKPRKSPVPIKRTNSLDTIAAPYLKGEWPRDPIVAYQAPAATTLHTLTVTTYAPTIPCSTTCDKYTQTEEGDFDEKDKKLKKSHKRSSSLGNEEKLKEKIKARLAKHHKEGSKSVATSGGQARISPVQGNHHAVPAGAISIGTPSKALNIQHIPNKPYKVVGSVEGLNQEIEKLYLTSHSRAEELDFRVRWGDDATPDGHRAPVLELLHPPGTRNADTQTPSGITYEHLLSERTVEGSTESSESSSQPSSRATSESPALPIIPDQVQEDSPRTHSSFTDGATIKRTDDEKEDEGESPDPEKCLFVREPPDGCEKVKIVEENRRASSEGEIYAGIFCPIKKPLDNFHIPSRSSAFCPLMKSYVPHADLKLPASPAKDRDC